MAAFSTIIGAIGVAAGIAGGVVQYAGQQKAAKAQERAEKLREQQMNLDAARQRREIARKALQARSQAVAAGVNQGAQFGSGLAGGTAQISSSANQGILGVNQNQEIGAGIFAQNYQEYKGNSMASMGSGISSFGGMLVQNQEMLGRIGTYFGGR